MLPCIGSKTFMYNIILPALSSSQLSNLCFYKQNNYNKTLLEELNHWNNKSYASTDWKCNIYTHSYDSTFFVLIANNLTILESRLLKRRKYWKHKNFQRYYASILWKYNFSASHCFFFLAKGLITFLIILTCDRITLMLHRFSSCQLMILSQLFCLQIHKSIGYQSIFKIYMCIIQFITYYSYTSVIITFNLGSFFFSAFTNLANDRMLL